MVRKTFASTVINRGKVLCAGRGKHLDVQRADLRESGFLVHTSARGAQADCWGLLGMEVWRGLGVVGSRLHPSPCPVLRQQLVVRGQLGLGVGRGSLAIVEGGVGKKGRVMGGRPWRRVGGRKWGRVEGYLKKGGRAQGLEAEWFPTPAPSSSFQCSLCRRPGALVASSPLPLCFSRSNANGAGHRRSGSRRGSLGCDPHSRGRRGRAGAVHL